nr:hypothetical protein [Tanacetum cinerariifolium]
MQKQLWSPPILAEQFELKYGLINMMTSDQFFGLEKDNPHDHIRWWQSVGKTYSRCVDDYRKQIQEIAKLTHAVNQQTSAVTTAMTAILKQFQASPPPASVKAVEEICVTCGGAHPYYQCLATGGNTLLELRDNIQGYVSAAAVNYNQGNSVYRPPTPTQQNQIIPLNELEKVKRMNEANMKSMQTQINNMKNKLRNEMKNSIQASLSNQTNEIKNMMASLFQMNTASTSRLGSLPSNTTARALIDVHGEEMILHDDDERLTLNIRHDTSSYSNQPQKESINLINVFSNSSEEFLKDLFSTNQPSGNLTFSSHPELTSPKVKYDTFDTKGGNVLPEKLLDLNSTKDLHPHLHVKPLSGGTTSSSSPNQLLEEFADKLALITFHLEYDDDLQFDSVSDPKEIEYMLYHDPNKDIDSSINDSIDQNNLADLNDNFVDSVPEMFTEEHALDYSSPPLFDEYDNDLFEVESDTQNVYDDPFDSKGEKIKESKLLIDELDLPCDFLPPFEYDSFPSEDFSRVDALPLTNNEDKVFNPCILIKENLFEIITRVAQDKKLAISHASLMIEDFDPPLYELPFFKEVPRSKILLPFSSKNEKKVFKPGIHTSREVQSSLIPELSHQGYKVFKINQVLKSPIKIFFSPVERTPTSGMFFVSTFTPLISSSMGDLGQAKRP